MFDTNWHVGKVDSSGVIYDVNYKFVNDDHIWCVIIGTQRGFYTHYKSLVEKV